MGLYPWWVSGDRRFVSGEFSPATVTGRLEGENDEDRAILQMRRLGRG